MTKICPKCEEKFNPEIFELNVNQQICDACFATNDKEYEKYKLKV